MCLFELQEQLRKYICKKKKISAVEFLAQKLCPLKLFPNYISKTSY